MVLDLYYSKYMKELIFIRNKNCEKKTIPSKM